MIFYPSKLKAWNDSRIYIFSWRDNRLIYSGKKLNKNCKAAVSFVLEIMLNVMLCCVHSSSSTPLWGGLRVSPSSLWIAPKHGKEAHSLFSFYCCDLLLVFFLNCSSPFYIFLFNLCLCLIILRPGSSVEDLQQHEAAAPKSFMFFMEMHEDPSGAYANEDYRVFVQIIGVKASTSYFR